MDIKKDDRPVDDGRKCANCDQWQRIQEYCFYWEAKRNADDSCRQFHWLDDYTKLCYERIKEIN